MGSTSSKTIVNQVSEQVTAISSQIAQKCNNLVNQRQNFNMFVGGDLIGNQISVSQSTDVDFRCAMTSNVQNDLQNQLIAAVQNIAKQQTVPINLQSVVNEAQTNISNSIRNNITLSNIQESYNQIAQGQKTSIVVAGSATGNVIDISQGSKVFAAATTDVLERSGVFNKIKSTADQLSQQRVVTPVGEVVSGVSDTVTGVADSMAKALSNSATVIMFIIVAFIVLVLIGVTIWFVFSGDDE